jgi:hypothetical protein
VLKKNTKQNFMPLAGWDAEDDDAKKLCAN